jgi:FkbM family methyltransferase
MRKRNHSFPNTINRIISYLQTKDFKGKYRLYLILKSLFPGHLIEHDSPQGNFALPLSELCFWIEGGPWNYYIEEFEPLFDVINQVNQPFTLLDLGADIGTVSRLVAMHCPGLESIVAFEPNKNSFEILARNLKTLSINTEAVNAAVSNYNGSARLIANESVNNDHEGYITKDTEGSTRVCTIDKWTEDNITASPINVVLKIDVEGQEIEAIQGAEHLIKSAETVILMIEIHPDVLQKTNSSPEDIFQALEQIRSVSFYLPKQGNTKIDRSDTFYNQFPRGQYDVIAATNNVSIGQKTRTAS